MNIGTDVVKELRERSGISVMQCKRALEEAHGDVEKALAILKEQGVALAKKKANRTLGAGVVQAYVHSTKKVGAMVLLSSETDFVAKNDEFVSLAYDIAMHLAAMGNSDVSKDDLLKQQFIKDPQMTIEKLIEGAIQKFGERIDITEFSRFKVE